jgi:hypothetical protein
MNFHREIIWNALDAYVNANYELLMDDPKKSWLIYWRDMNCPHERTAQLLEQRITECEYQLNHLPVGRRTLKQPALAILNSIKEQTDYSGQRILLEIVSRTLELSLNSPTYAIDAFNEKAELLKISHPMFYTIAGLIKAFLGCVLLIPSLGHSGVIIKSGVATAKSGFFYTDKLELADKIYEFTQIL